METAPTAAELAARLSDASGVTAHSIAADLTLMIRRGEILVGSKLPPVREIAQELWVSPSTISAAWRTLKLRGILEGQGRAGVTVVRAPDTPKPERYTASRPFAAEISYDLGASSPDPALLPSLRDALAHIPEGGLNSYTRDRITPNLEAAASDNWPYRPRSLMAVSGGYDGIRLILQTFMNAGDWVLVENPSPPRILDLVSATGARTRFLPRDDEGIIPEALEDALKLRPAAVILQPGIHNPVGTTVTDQRCQALASVLDGSSTLVVEDDGVGALFSGTVCPLAERLTGPHLYVRSFSKSHGPDLRLAIVEGEPETIDKVHAFFGYGAGWVSRPLQEALAWMLRDASSQEQLLLARQIYDKRRIALFEALRAAEIDVKPGRGLDLLIPVRDEGYAQGVMAAHGVLVARGSNFTPSKQEGSWIRVATSVLPEESAKSVALLLAQAAQ